MLPPCGTQGKEAESPLSVLSLGCPNLKEQERSVPVLYTHLRTTGTGWSYVLDHATCRRRHGCDERDAVVRQNASRAQPGELQVLTLPRAAVLCAQLFHEGGSLIVCSFVRVKILQLFMRMERRSQSVPVNFCTGICSDQQ